MKSRERPLRSFLQSATVRVLQDFLEPLRKLCCQIRVRIEPAYRPAGRIALLVDYHYGWQLIDAKFFGNGAIRITEHGYLVFSPESSQLIFGSEVLRFSRIGIGAHPINCHAPACVIVSEFLDSFEL